ncbi:MAG: porin [Gammaproteobacteria bacterium]
MIKKILPVMIGAALVGVTGSAVADVTAMGHIDTSMNSTKNELLSNNDRLNNLTCTTCSFGFKGSEDLGNGLSAIFKIDFQYDTTERNRGLTDRDQWVGLGSNFGKLRIGTISTVYKSHGAMIDPIYRTVGQGRDWGLQSGLHTGAGDTEAQGRATNTIRYDSPTFAGFQVAGHYTVQTETESDPNADSPWGIGGHWQGGGFLVFADYITSDAGGDDDAWKVGGRFGFDKFAIFGQYEGDGGAISGRSNGAVYDSDLDTDIDYVGVGDGADTWFVGGTAGFGNNLIYAAYGQGGDKNGATGSYIDNTGTVPVVVEVDNVNTKYDSWEIFGVHSLSKRTKAYLGFVQQDYDDLGKIDNWALGMKHTF